MLRSTSIFHNDVVSFTARPTARRPRPIVVAAFIGAVVASAMLVTQIAPNHAAASYGSQPFAHIPH